MAGKTKKDKWAKERAKAIASGASPEAPFGLTLKGRARRRPLGSYPSSTGKKINVTAVQDNWRTRLQRSRIKFDDDQKAVYLSALSDHGRKGSAAIAAGVCGNTVIAHLDNDPDFAEGFAEATVAYRDKFVGHGVNLAYEGIEVRKFNKDGDLIELRRDYPIPLVVMEMKRVEPDYRDKQTIDLNATGGGVLIAPAGITPEAWIAREEEENLLKLAPPDVIEHVDADAEE